MNYDWQLIITDEWVLVMFFGDFSDCDVFAEVGVPLISSANR
jgi:hypothetical protein